jgi:hypothetical protein
MKRSQLAHSPGRKIAVVQDDVPGENVFLSLCDRWKKHKKDLKPQGEMKYQ